MIPGATFLDEVSTRQLTGAHSSTVISSPQTGLRPLAVSIVGRPPVEQLDIGCGELRFHLSRQFAEQPEQRRAVLPGRAAVDEAESQEQVPITNRVQQRVKPFLVAGALALELPVERKQFVVVLDHR